jgi:polysaccharide biosynthesis transport protein
MLDTSPGPAAAPSPRRRDAGERAGPRDAPAVPVQAVLGMLRRRLVPLLACAVVIPALAFVALRQTAPLFTASGTLLYDPAEYKPHELQSILRVDPTTPATMASQAEVLRSLRSIERVADQLELFRKPEFNPALRRPPILARLARWLRPGLGLDTLPRPDPAGEPARNAVLVATQQALDVHPVTGSRALEVTFTAGDPVLAAAVVNRLMDVYIRDQLAAKFRAVRRAQDWLESRAAELRLEVRSAEDRVAAYRTREGMVRGMHAGLDAEQISTQTENLERARSDLAQAEGRLDTARNGAGAAAMAAVAPSVVEAQQQVDVLTGQLHSLLGRLGPNHPDVRAAQRQVEQARSAVAAARARVVGATDADVRAARARVAALEQDLAHARTQSENQGTAQIPLREMERDLDASRTLLQSVLDRLQETRQQAAVESADARELSLALPPGEPSFPRIRPTLAAAGAFGVVLGLLAAYLMELADTTLKSGDDVRAFLGLPCLALIPRVERRALRWMPIAEYLAHKPTTPFAEQVRALRAGLWLGRERPRTIAIAAARPAEGKTTVTLALGRSAALSGERVVAIDCDIRHPSFPRLAGTEPEPGLADVLRGSARLEDVLRKDHLTDMAFIPAGQGGPETLGLFMSEGMGRLLQTLRDEYELVLLDAPPAHAMADTRVIAQIADATLLCVRWRATPRAVVQNAVELLEAAGASVAGVALTRVDARAHRRSGAADAEACHPRYRRYYQD